MGYGLGVFLSALGLILAFAVTDMISNVDLTMVGWIIALAGVLIVVLTAVQANSRRRATSVATTTHSDGVPSRTRRRRSDPGSPPTGARPAGAAPLSCVRMLGAPTYCQVIQ